MKTFFKIIISLITVVGLVVIGIIVSVRMEYRDKIYAQIEDVPEQSMVVVLGASVKRDQTPSQALEDRLRLAADIWYAGKAEKIILSGDDGRWAQPEIAAMVGYMYELGVPDEVLIADGNNARTHDSCYRLKNELGQDKVVLITQGFHLPRALYLCNKVGLDAWGIESNFQSYDRGGWFLLRDWLASFLAFWDIATEQLPSYLENS
ncbi:YdcF family protein [Patescibacteria group bacterium]|nr:YdcF family protein [Patescibacteria group bacterium]MBU1922557.1 YdcF family protein [Patescibacteria group bacterium]